MKRCNKLFQHLATLILFASMFDAVLAVDHVKLIRHGETIEVDGQVAVEAQDGGLLLHLPDGQLWVVQPDELISKSSDDQPFELLDKQQLSDKLLSEVPVGFQIYETPHYIICYNTSKAYAQWCGGLFERLYRGFHNYWQRRGIELEPTPPMVALVFQDQASFAEYSKPELKDAVNAIIGYYSLATNRITMYDLTGVDELRQAGGGSRGSLRHIRQILSRPEAERTVATIVHEATHQLVFNTGMQQRFADIPVWLNEGLAMYFESPDNSSRGWRSIGSINETRLGQMQRYLSERPEHSLVTLLNSDGRFRDARTAEAAYAESWSLVYHLLRTNSDGFVQYMNTMKQKPPLGQDSPAQRLQEFRDAFGELDQVDEEMVQLIQGL